MELTKLKTNKLLYKVCRSSVVGGMTGVKGQSPSDEGSGTPKAEFI